MSFSFFDDEKKNYYEILDLNPGASPVDIRQAYLRAKGAYGKDSAAIYSLFDSAEIKAVLDRIEEAYLVLSNIERRKEYDRAHGLIQNHFEPSPELVANSRPHPVGERAFSFSAGASGEPLETAALEKPKAPPSMPPPPLDRPGVRRIDIVSYRDTYNTVSQQLEAELQNGAETGGAFLKKVREAYGVSLQELSDFTKISKLYLTSIEAEDPKGLPAGAYVRSFIVQVAKALKLPTERVANGYMKAYLTPPKKQP